MLLLFSSLLCSLSLSLASTDFGVPPFILPGTLPSPAVGVDDDNVLLPSQFLRIRFASLHLMSSRNLLIPIRTLSQSGKRGKEEEEKIEQNRTLLFSPLLDKVYTTTTTTTTKGFGGFPFEKREL